MGLDVVCGLFVLQCTDQMLVKFLLAAIKAAIEYFAQIPSASPMNYKRLVLDFYSFYSSQQTNFQVS